MESKLHTTPSYFKVLKVCGLRRTGKGSGAAISVFALPPGKYEVVMVGKKQGKSRFVVTKGTYKGVELC